MGYIAESKLEGKLKEMQVGAFKGEVCQITRKEQGRVKFKAMLEGKMVSLDGNQWLEGRFLLISSEYFYIV